MYAHLKLIMNAGLTKEEYNRIKPAIEKQNMKTLQWCSILCTVMMLMLVMVTYLPNFVVLKMNRCAYFVFASISFLVFCMNWYLIHKKIFTIKYLFYFFLLSFTIFSIYIGVVTNTDQRASTICVLLLAIPLLITDKPSRISLLLSISTLLFCVATYYFKSHTLFVSDFLNCFCIFVISIAVNFTQQNMKYRSMNDEYMIEQNNIQLIQAQKLQLEESRISIILSQIQPHFLYNALLVIQELCVVNPKEAEQATIEFSKFLRGNLDSLNTDKPIPFSKELQHTKYYLALEQKRFGKKLRVEWNLHTTSFMIPVLTLQPIVENAVRYGVTKKSGGGTVRITAEELDDFFKIIVEDDGIGFDMYKSKEDGRSHIGITNVKKRLKDMCGGNLIIESKENVGTTATIILPKNFTSEKQGK